MANKLELTWYGKDEHIRIARQDLWGRLLPIYILSMASKTFLLLRPIPPFTISYSYYKEDHITGFEVGCVVF